MSMRNDSARERHHPAELSARRPYAHAGAVETDASPHPFGHLAASVPVWIDVGAADPFLEADTNLAHELKARGTPVKLVVHGGGHSGWSARMGEYLRFYATACPR